MYVGLKEEYIRSITIGNGSFRQYLLSLLITVISAGARLEARIKIPSEQLETGGVGEHAQVRMEIVV